MLSKNIFVYDKNASHLGVIQYGIHYHVHTRNVANTTEGVKFSYLWWSHVTDVS